MIITVKKHSLLRIGETSISVTNSQGRPVHIDVSQAANVDITEVGITHTTLTLSRILRNEDIHINVPNENVEQFHMLLSKHVRKALFSKK